MGKIPGQQSIAFDRFSLAGVALWSIRGLLAQGVDLLAVAPAHLTPWTSVRVCASPRGVRIFAQAGTRGAHASHCMAGCLRAGQCVAIAWFRSLPLVDL
jgi:hypothetical protein